MAEEGWTVLQSFDRPGGKMIGYSRNGEDIQISINQEEDGVLVGILSTP